MDLIQVSVWDVDYHALLTVNNKTKGTMVVKVFFLHTFSMPEVALGGPKSVSIAHRFRFYKGVLFKCHIDVNVHTIPVDVYEKTRSIKFNTSFAFEITRH